MKHREYMEIALELAERAFEQGEVPVGALIVREDGIIGAGYNRVESIKSPLAHAEIVALQQAITFSGGKYLNDATMYCTLEPCPMCAGAALHARIERIVYGAADIRWGVCGTLYNLPEDRRFNHKIELIGGIMEKECSELLKKFFESRRG